ncbi:cadherin-related tumor suppressor [Caerostris extrusa]|uniref:Cadherin-related tumor suppressor n=1 Tax=Caerostris extrusa TaxID=172846 RepID=A0AAV4X9L5_CAEEX|nr:cadherin-related tumor suppressor [Caerostris extrusa]
MTDFFLLRATDADFGINRQLTYAITAGNDEKSDSAFFRMATYTWKRPLDREKRDFFTPLTVAAQDNGRELCSSSFYIAENEPPDTCRGRLSAEDLDKGRNAELTYTITNTQTDFMINPKTGFIRTLRYFDREQIVEASGHDYFDHGCGCDGWKC